MLLLLFTAILDCLVTILDCFLAGDRFYDKEIAGTIEEIAGAVAWLAVPEPASSTKVDTFCAEHSWHMVALVTCLPTVGTLTDVVLTTGALESHLASHMTF